MVGRGGWGGKGGEQDVEDDSLADDSIREPCFGAAKTAEGLGLSAKGNEKTRGKEGQLVEGGGGQLLQLQQGKG